MRSRYVPATARSVLSTSATARIRAIPATRRATLARSARPNSRLATARWATSAIWWPNARTRPRAVKGPNKGLIIGIIVGAGVLVLALVITLVVWLFSVSDVGDPIDTSAGQSSGTEIDNDLPPAPVLPAGSRVAAGDYHSCAITEDEQVWCWGNNDLKQSNPASDEKVVGPTQLDVHDAVALAASSSNTCALHDDKTLTCWGRNDLKTLGVADYDSSKLFHTPDLTEPVIAVSAGPNHFCALTENGEVYCWGWNGIGEAVPQAYPAVEKVAVPTKVRLEQKASMIAGGNDHTCAVLEDNSVACWGRAEYGATGVDT